MAEAIRLDDACGAVTWGNAIQKWPGEGYRRLGSTQERRFAKMFGPFFPEWLPQLFSTSPTCEPPL